MTWSSTGINFRGCLDAEALFQSSAVLDVQLNLSTFQRVWVILVLRIKIIGSTQDHRQRVCKVCSLMDTTYQNKNAIFYVVHCMWTKYFIAMLLKGSGVLSICAHHCWNFSITSSFISLQCKILNCILQLLIQKTRIH